LEALTKNKVNEEVAEAMLEYLGKFIYKMAAWQVDEQTKL